MIIYRGVLYHIRRHFGKFDALNIGVFYRPESQKLQSWITLVLLKVLTWNLLYQWQVLTIEDDWWRHQHDDVIMRVIYRPEPKITCHCYSFKLIPLAELKLFNFIIFDFLVCKIHRNKWQKKWNHFCRSIIEGYYWCKFQVHNNWPTKMVSFFCHLLLAYFTDQNVKNYKVE